MTKYTLFLRQRSDGTYQASVPAMPGVTAVGETRAAAIEALERSIRAALETAEFVTLDLPDPPTRPAASRNPWLASAGSFADDPTLETLLAEIYVARGAE